MHGYKTSTRRYPSMRTRPPQACRWVSITAHYLHPQRRRISPNLRRSRDKNLPEKIPPHPPTVIIDSPLSSFFVPSIILAFHLTTHQLYFVFHLYCPQTLLRLFAGLGVAGEVVYLSSGTRLGSAMPPGFGLRCRASHDPPGSLDQSSRDL